MFALLALTVITAPPVVSGASGCIDPGEVAREIEARAPRELELARVHVRVDVVLSDTGAQSDADADVVTIATSLDDGAPLVRALPFTREDCPAGARLVAAVAAQHLEALAPGGVVPPPAPVPVAPAPAPRPVVPAEAPAPVAPVMSVAPPRDSIRLRPSGQLGGALGVAPFLPAVRGQLALGIGFLRGWPDLVIGAAAGLSAPLSIGGGTAQLAHGGALVGIGGGIEVGEGAELVAQGLVHGGVTAAAGSGFDRPETAWVPDASVAITAGALLWALRLDIGADVAVLRPALEAGNGSHVSTSLVNVFALVGFSFDVWP